MRWRARAVATPAEHTGSSPEWGGGFRGAASRGTRRPPSVNRAKPGILILTHIGRSPWRKRDRSLAPARNSLARDREASPGATAGRVLDDPVPHLAGALVAVGVQADASPGGTGRGGRAKPGLGAIGESSPQDPRRRRGGRLVRRRPRRCAERPGAARPQRAAVEQP